jgi:2-polyprenyl-3-methyl-5-hydroxy-6-metoxy-1,4-benzoquinol methylase
MPSPPAPPLSAEPDWPADWPADWLEDVDACLWCKGMARRPLVSGVRDWFFAAVPGEFSFAQCGECCSLLLERRPVAAHIGKAYRSYYTHSSEAADAHRRSLMQRIGRGLAGRYARSRYARSAGVADAVCSQLFGFFPVRRAEVDAVHRHLPRCPAEVLDFGCGNGDFLARAQALGHRCVGVDFDPEAVNFVKGRGIEVYEPDALAEAGFEGRFDIVTAAHVVEHVADPLALLGDFRRWLKPGGHLFIEVPNAEASGLAKHGRFWRGLEAPRHFSLPSAAGLRDALEKAGFTVAMMGQRAFSHHFMDDASQAAALANHGPAAGAGAGAGAVQGLSGPELLTCLARVR